MGVVATWKLRWETWDLRGLILLSLCLQILLIFLAPLRKRVSKALLKTPLWLAYLLADATASFTVGLISKSQGDTSCPLANPPSGPFADPPSSPFADCRPGPFADPTILAFWAPFLLVHLGGPDTITAFALEDNELWLRHLLGLGFHCWVVGYAFFQSFSNHKFWIPTLLMFVVGVIKYIERTRALYLASSRRFKNSLLRKPDPGPNYAKLMDEYISNIEARFSTEIEMIPEPSRANRTGNTEPMEDLNDLQVVQVAHKYFSTFTGLIADSIFSFHERNQSRDFFLKQTPRDAFKVIEVELNFFYEILYTKAMVLLRSKIGYPFRILSFILNCAALVAFYLIEEKKFEKIDIGISYTLLLSAIALDLISFVMVLHSDWTVVALTKSDSPNWYIRILQWLLNVDRKRRPSNPERKPIWFNPRKIMQIMRLRWSESLSQYSLINYCLHPRAELWEKTIGKFGLTNMLDGLKYVETVDFTNDLRDLIFDELKMKSELADDIETTKDIFDARRDWILRYESHTNLLHWINEVGFDESIILWHIATELCYYDGAEVKENPNDTRNQTNSGNSANEDIKDNRKLSKLLSDYLLYLLIMQSTLLSTIAGIGQIRFIDTYAEAKKFFRGRKILEDGKNSCLNVFNLGKCFCCYFNKCCSKRENGLDKLHVRACKSILEVNTEVEPVTVKGDRSKSMLFDACILAKELKKIGRPEEMWKIISKVLVELLSYAASHCRANTHVTQLSKGGQLLTLVWLLMAHLGLGDQFQISEGHARAKLIVTK